MYMLLMIIKNFMLFFAGMGFGVIMFSYYLYKKDMGSFPVSLFYLAAALSVIAIVSSVIIVKPF